MTAHSGSDVWCAHKTRCQLEPRESGLFSTSYIRREINIIYPGQPLFLFPSNCANSALSWIW